MSRLPEGIMCRLGLSVALLVCLAGAANATYTPLTVPERIALAEDIVRGRIIALGADTYDLEVSESYKGGVSIGEAVRVRRFRTWACAMRPREYAVGEEVIVFLARDGVATYCSLGAGCEGEALTDADGDGFLLAFPWRRSNGRLAGECELPASAIAEAVRSLAPLIGAITDERGRPIGLVLEVPDAAARLEALEASPNRLLAEAAREARRIIAHGVRRE